MTRLSSWWFAPAPAERLAALRILIGGFGLTYLLAVLPELAALARHGARQFQPHGVARVLDAPLPPWLALALAVVTCALMAAFTLGVAYRALAPLAAAALLWTLTYRNAWGMVFHTENLLVLHVLGLAFSPAADAWSIDARRGRLDRTGGAGYGWPLRLLAALTAATYLLAGVAKLRLAGAGWLDGELLRDQIAIDNLRKAMVGDGVAPFASLVLDHPAPLVVFSGLTLILELGAPLALVHRRLGQGWALAAWGFHLGVVLLMNIWFVYPLAGLAYLPFLPAERGVLRAISLARGIFGGGRPVRSTG